jgi:hypothetical protein
MSENTDNLNPIKCPNFDMCGTIAPEWYYECHRGTCMNCAITFGGKLTFYESEEECIVCLETGKTVKFLRCNHKVCHKCFKRCFYGKEREEEPVFPYDDNIWDEYEEDENNEKWLKEYPLISEWNKRCDEIEHYYQSKYDSEENLRKCALCRT